MTLELILQILVFPALGFLMLQIQRLDVKVSEQARDIAHCEHRINHIEQQLEQQNQNQ